jgi:hypothetical protein
MGADGDEPEPEWGGGEEYWIGMKPVGTVVFFGVSNEKGTFFEGEIELKQPFDISKLELGYDEIDGNDIINSVRYDGEQIDNWGGDTNGKSSDFGFYLVKDSNTWEKYSNMDDIIYEMTEWFPKKIKPVHEGVYMVKTAGKNSYTYQARWTGTRWINQWSEDNTETEDLKIKEWQGLAQDPNAGVSYQDRVDLEAALEELKAEFEVLCAESEAADVVCPICKWQGTVDETVDRDEQMRCPECDDIVEFKQEK